MSLVSRLQHSWNAFLSKDDDFSKNPYDSMMGQIMEFDQIM